MVSELGGLPSIVSNEGSRFRFGDVIRITGHEFNTPKYEFEYRYIAADLVSIIYMSGVDQHILPLFHIPLKGVQ